MGYHGFPLLDDFSGPSGRTALTRGSMTPETRAWREGLAALAARRRTASSVGALTPEAAAAERLILTAHFARWIDGLPALDEARTTFADATPESDPLPAVVITTSPGGIAVVDELLSGGGPLVARLQPRVVATTEVDYRAWCIQNPDSAHRLHLNHWSWIKMRVPRQRHAEFAPHALDPGAEYWLHRTGTAGAGRSDDRSAGLWTFDGRHAVLIDPRVDEGRVRPPRS